MTSRDPCDIVRTFIEGWGPGRARLVQTFQDYFTDDIVWENVGIVTTNGIAEAVAILDGFPLPFDYISADILHIAAAGNAVLTEWIDYFHRADGTIVGDLRLCGIFEIAGDRISRWRDYFDTAPYVT